MQIHTYTVRFCTPESLASDGGRVAAVQAAKHGFVPLSFLYHHFQSCFVYLCAIGRLLHAGDSGAGRRTADGGAGDLPAPSRRHRGRAAASGTRRRDQAGPDPRYYLSVYVDIHVIYRFRRTALDNFPLPAGGHCRRAAGASRRDQGGHCRRVQPEQAAGVCRRTAHEMIHILHMLPEQRQMFVLHVVHTRLHSQRCFSVATGRLWEACGAAYVSTF